MTVRVGVLGAGAMGGLFGAELADHGHDTLLVDVSQETVDRINATGITVREGRSERVVRARATVDPVEEAPVDLLLVFVKCYATEPAMTLARPLIGPATTTLSLQNGWGNGEQLERLLGGDERLLVGVTYHSATMVRPAVVDHTATGTTYVGPWGCASPAVTESAAGALRAVGWEVNADPAIAARIWKKLVLNTAANATAAFTGLRSGALPNQPHIADLMERLAREVVAVAQAQGYAIDPDEAVAETFASLRKAGEAKSSMRQDVEAGRPTEIEVIAGAVLRAGREHSVPTPTTAALYALVKGYEYARELT